MSYVPTMDEVINGSPVGTGIYRIQLEILLDEKGNPKTVEGTHPLSGIEFIKGVAITSIKKHVEHARSMSWDFCELTMEEAEAYEDTHEFVQNMMSQKRRADDLDKREAQLATQESNSPAPVVGETETEMRDRVRKEIREEEAAEKAAEKIVAEAKMSVAEKRKKAKEGKAQKATAKA